MKKWGTKDERLRFAANKLVSTLPNHMSELCDPVVINEIMNIIDAALDDDDLTVLVATLHKEYVEKIDVIKKDVMKQLRMELVLLQNATKV